MSYGVHKYYTRKLPHHYPFLLAVSLTAQAAQLLDNSPTLRYSRSGNIFQSSLHPSYKTQKTPSQAFLTESITGTVGRALIREVYKRTGCVHGIHGSMSRVAEAATQRAGGHPVEQISAGVSGAVVLYRHGLFPRQVGVLH
jgi:hypothetical protein